ncbi:hypothetical protein [Nevskia ramosa]|uniref:hypothetical protein n=1 Tax=Nevskia ramosa TaxID=64002 RepID=UPI003D0E0923
MASDLYANRLFLAVRRLQDQPPGFADVQQYFTKPDERFNLPLASFRVYGNFDEALTIQAAAALDSPEQEMTERLLILPTAALLRTLKLQAGGDSGLRRGR